MNERAKRGYNKHLAPPIVMLPDLPDAACKGIGSDQFVPDDGGSGQVHFDPRPAQRVCRRCPERDRCLGVALTSPLLVGVWGGTTTKDRQALPADLRQRLWEATRSGDRAEYAEALAAAVGWFRTEQSMQEAS